MSCEHCKYWSKEDSHILRGYNGNYGVCVAANTTDSEGKMDAICFSESVSAELITRKDFGCVNQKSKP
jgi:hypothetical protein